MLLLVLTSFTVKNEYDPSLYFSVFTKTSPSHDIINNTVLPLKALLSFRLVKIRLTLVMTADDENLSADNDIMEKRNELFDQPFYL